MKKTTIIGILALMVVGLIASTGVVSAYGGMGQGMREGNGNGITIYGQNEDAIAAIEDNDYDAWKEAMISELTESKFETLVERHSEMSVRQEKMDAVRDAIDNGDYDAYVSATQELESYQNKEVMDEDAFNTMVDIHKAIADGDYETADALREDNGFHPQENNFFGRIKGFFGRI